MIQSILSSLNPFLSLDTSCNSSKKKEDIHVEIGSSQPVIDRVRNILSIPDKLLLGSYAVKSGALSEENLQLVKKYLHKHHLHDVYVSVNQYKPFAVWHRVFTNPKTSFLAKVLFGTPSSLLETLAVTKLTGILGDHYNPLSNTLYLFSNHPALALHECGHAKDANSRKNPILYQALNYFPVFSLYQEYLASAYAIEYLKKKKLDSQAYRLLVPSFATFIASTLIDWPVQFKIDVLRKSFSLQLAEFTQVWQFLAIIVAGHVAGNILFRSVSLTSKHRAEAKSPY